MSLEVNVTKRFDGFTLHAAFTAGDTATALLGASGCGKSMTLRCIAGIVRPDEGRIVLDGRVLFDSTQGIDLPPQQRNVGLLFQNYALFPNMTVEQNILSALKKEKDPAARRAACAEALRAMRLEELAKRLPGALSGGQQQRAALARILAAKPRILMLDEPFSALDSYLREEVEGEVGSLLAGFAGTALLVTHNRDEAYRLCREDALAAVGSTGCLMFLVLGFANGIAQGFGVMVSHAFGAKDMKLLRHCVALSLLLTVVISMILTVPTVAFSRQLLLWLNTPENILTLANRYIRVIFAGIFATMAYNVASGILRGIGDSRTPLYFLILSSGLNIFLDIFLIVVVKLGTAGAAYATVISQAVSAVLCFIVMFRKYDILRTTREDYYCDFHEIRRMLSVGIPMALNYSITAIGTMILQSAVNVFGSSVVAAFTAASKVSNIATQTMPTLGTAMATYCGQNLGAGKHDRIFRGMKDAFYLCFFAAGAAALLCCLAGPTMVGWFIHNPSEQTLHAAMQYLHIASIFMLPLAWIFVYRNGLQGLDRGLVPMLSGVLELFSRYAVILIATKPFGYVGVCSADAAAWLTTGILLIVTYMIWKHRVKKQLNAENATMNCIK